jgi:CheY-like chemotaxis protein
VTSARILLVEDEYAGAEVLALILREEGYAVTVASNGRQGLDKVHEARPDLIVTDYMMPMMNGAEMAREIRSLPDFAATPVLLISGVPEEMLQAPSGSYDAFLRKPFEATAFLSAIASALADRQPG